MLNTALIRSVDVLILGGGSAAVASALASHAAGASVFLAAPRNYLGDDLCGSLQLHLSDDISYEHPIAAALRLDNPTPRLVKLALEDRMVKAGVDFVFGSYPVAALHDEQDEICGAVIANRAGRQAIQAKYVIDATPRGLYARLAGATFNEFKAQTINYRRRILAPLDADLNDWQQLPGTLFLEGKEDKHDFAIYEQQGVYELSQATPSALAQFEQHSYNTHWIAESNQIAEDSIYQLNDRLLNGGADENKFSLENMSCLNGRCAVLSTQASISDELAATLAQPGALLDHADTVGAEFAKRAQDESERAAVKSVCTNASTDKELNNTLMVRSNGLRPSDSSIPQLQEETHNVPEIGSVDVLIVGGGTGGAPAGIAAARQGASTIILEFQSHLGGVGTVGQISVYYFGNRIGFTEEIDNGVHAMGENPAYKADSGRWNPGWKQAWYHKAATEAGAAIWYQASVYGVQKIGDRVTGILVAGPFGHGLIRCGAVVDATGAAEVAGNAGAPVRVIDDEHIAVQGTGLSPVSPESDRV